MATSKLITAKLKRTLHNAQSAWWVLLIIAGYSAFAWYFLGTSCLLASTLGLPCPGCGITRAFVLLLHGDLAGSLHFYPMLIPSVIFACVYVALHLACENKPRYLQKSLIAFAIALLCVYALRMALMFPHTPPMVINERAVLMRGLCLLGVR